MRAYRAIFFDWDGTAVLNRRAPVDEAAAAMKPLLAGGVRLLVVSGTTYPNIAGGLLHECFTAEERRNLYFGLGRGSYNYGFDETGGRIAVADPGVDKETLLRIHDAAYGVHRTLLERYGYQSDIIFDRPNYCKIDIMNGNDRAKSLFLSGNEIEDAKQTLAAHGIEGGISALIALAEEEGRKAGIRPKVTCDAKYLELGVLNKADNVDALLRRVLQPAGIRPEDCAFWGDEYLELDQGILGSDSFMHTPLSAPGDFFDVGTVPGKRPAWVKHLGGSVDTFLAFLREQGALCVR